MNNLGEFRLVAVLHVKVSVYAGGIRGSAKSRECGPILGLMAERKNLKTIPKIFNDGLFEFLSLLIPILFDALLGFVIFGILLLFAWVFGLTRALGILKQEHLDAYELAHFWLNYGVFMAVGFSVLLRVVKRIFKGD